MRAGLFQPLIVALLVTTPETVHDWTFSVSGWTIGIQEFRLREYSSSVVYFGPIGFLTGHSATTVAAISCGCVVALLIGLTAIIPKMTRRSQ